MHNGLPCVTFDCPFGPSDVVADNVNGYVVKDGDVPGFAEKLCHLIEDDNLRSSFSHASIERAKIFNQDVVMARWKALVEELVSQRA